MWGRLRCSICKMAVCMDCMSIEEVSDRSRCNFCRTAQRFISKTFYDRSPERDEDKPPPKPDKSQQGRRTAAKPKGSVAKAPGWQAGSRSRHRSGKKRMLMQRKQGSQMKAGELASPAKCLKLFLYQ